MEPIIVNLSQLIDSVSKSELKMFGVARKEMYYKKISDFESFFWSKEELYRDLLRPVCDQNTYTYTVFVDGQQLQMVEYRGRADVLKMQVVDAICRKLEGCKQERFGVVVESPDFKNSCSGSPWFEVGMKTKEEIYYDLLNSTCGVDLWTIYTNDEAIKLRWCDKEDGAIACNDGKFELI